MDPERWERIAELYDAALEQEPSRRSAFVAEVSQGDEALRRELESLLRQDVSGHGVLERVADDAGSLIAAAGRHMPAAVGRYRILGLIGEGGMGIVYEAEQDHPRRKVALKLLKAGVTSPALLRRFERESEALGRLQHPGIAHIYEAGVAGTDFGPQPYLAMELVRGVTLLKYATSRTLNVNQRLGLMLKLCESVQHAHEHGIIHRDLKPNNILIDESGHPKILDFGVARFTDSDVELTRQTDFGELIGTLGYMSPEQLAGDPLAVDFRSDIYALGVVFYELLTGRLPYEASRNVYEASRSIREEEPTRLSATDPGYRGDLETIVQKAIEKDKSRRYGSAKELATDIHRYLNNQPIMARPPSTSYQLRKFAVRHNKLVGAVLAVFASLVAGVVVSAREAIRANRQTATAKAVSDFLQNDLLAQAGSRAQAGSNGKVDPDLKVRTALDRAASRIAGKFGSQPELEASVRDTIGTSYRDLGLYTEARQQFERALQLRRQMLGPEDPDTLRSANHLAQLALDEGRYAPAETLFHEVLKNNRRQSEDPQIGIEAMTGLAQVYASQGDYGRSRALLAQSLEAQKKVLGERHPAVLAAMSELAAQYANEGKFAEAAGLEEKALAMRRQVLGEEHPDTLASLDDLAYDYRQLGDFARAEPIFQEALKLRRRVLGETHPETLLTMKNLGRLYYSQGKYESAEPLLTESFEARRKVLGENHPDTLQSMSNLAALYWKQGKFSDAEQLFQKALQAERKVLGPRHPTTLGEMQSLAAMNLERHDYRKAEPLLREVIAGQENTSRPWTRDYSRGMLGAALAGLGRYDEAEPLLLSSYDAILRAFDSIPSENRSILNRIRNWIVDMYQAWGKPEKAAEWRKKSATPKI